MSLKDMLGNVFGYTDLDEALESFYFLGPFTSAWDYEGALRYLRVIAGYSDQKIISRIHFLVNKDIRETSKDNPERVSTTEYPCRRYYHYSSDMSVDEKESLCRMLGDIQAVPEQVQVFKRLYHQTIEPVASNPLQSDVNEIGSIFTWGISRSNKYGCTDASACTIDPADVRNTIALGCPIKETQNSYGRSTDKEYAWLENKYAPLIPGTLSFEKAFVKDNPFNVRYIRESHLSEGLCFDPARSGRVSAWDIPFAFRSKRVCAALLEKTLERPWPKRDLEGSVGVLLLYFPYGSFTPEIKKLVERECPGCIGSVPDEAEWGNENMNGWLARES